MTFISYSQNYEDVMLRRALKDVDTGVYIDIGANDPVIDSVTKAFYDVGWRGISVEPVTVWFEKLQQDRQDDINLQLVVGADKGKIDFYEVVGTGLSTTDESIAKRHSQEHGFEIRKYKVPLVTLTTICEKYPHQDIHFLKIDVEGGELAVLKGLDLKKIRPWIILVESTLPNSEIENYEEWEYSLTERGYHYVYFDGLNRYYVADEHNELDVSFKVPPNYFDYFKRIGELNLERKLDENWSASNARIEGLVSELNIEKNKSIQLAGELSNKDSVMLESKSSQAHSVWLQNEWDASKSTIEGLHAKVVKSDKKIQENETKQQELILRMLEKESRLLEKESRLLEGAGLLADNKQLINRLQFSLEERNTHGEIIELELQESKAKADELNHLSQHWESLAELQGKELEVAKAKIDEHQRAEQLAVELSAAGIENKQQIDKLHVSLIDSKEKQEALKTALKEIGQQRLQLEMQVQALHQKETQLDDKLSKKEDAINWLNNEWDAAKHKIDELHQSSHHWWSMADQQSKELDEVRNKSDELNHSSHHWWLESDRLSKELQTLYNSKSWRITWPLRKLMLFFKWLFFLPINFILWLVHLPKRTVRWSLLKGMAYALKHPALKVRAMAWLRNYPNFETKLRRLAQARGFVVAMEKTSPIFTQALPGSVTPQMPDEPIQKLREPQQVAIVNESAQSGANLALLTPSARCIYRELKTAKVQHDKDKESLSCVL
jgi:FkbM family methyltransferase